MDALSMDKNIDKDQAVSCNQAVSHVACLHIPFSVCRVGFPQGGYI